MGELQWRWVMGLMVQLAMLGSTAEAKADCFKSVFAFGDGIFDTGSVSAVFPSILNYDFPPYGSTYFKKPAGRFSDGRLVLDFLTEALGIPTMIPSYLQTVTSDFAYGVSFASAYSTIGTVSTGQTAGPLMFLSPFAISVQALHYAEFKSTTKNIIQQSKDNNEIAMEGTDTSLAARLPPYEEFGDGLYLFSTGAHDIVNYLNKNMSISDIRPKLSGLITAYSTTIKTLITKHGVKNVVVFDVEPLGCQPFLLTLIPHTSQDVDDKGCLIAVNDLVKRFNSMLKKSVQSWRTTFKVNVVFLSQFDIRMELMNDASSGFLKTNAACCGLPVSPYNVLIAVQCGPPVFDPEAQKEVSAFPCEDPGSHLYWDAMYTTEAANRYITKKILTGKYFDIPFDRLSSCATNRFS